MYGIQRSRSSIYALDLTSVLSLRYHEFFIRYSFQMANNVIPVPNLGNNTLVYQMHPSVDLEIRKRCKHKYSDHNVCP